MRLIDTHCHLDDAVFAGDLDSVLDESRRHGVTAWIVVGFEPERWASSIGLAQRTPGMRQMLGVHPSASAEWSSGIARQLETLLVETGAVAIGEIGFDFYRDNPPIDIQERALRDQLAIARNVGLPAVFHMRNAEDALLRVLRSEAHLPSVVLHSFDGSDTLRHWALEHNGYLGVGGLATRQRSVDLRRQLAESPLDRLVLETDSPYLVPAKQKDRRNVPRHVRTVAAVLADLTGLDISTIADRTTENARRVFGKAVVDA